MLGADRFLSKRIWEASPDMKNLATRGVAFGDGDFELLDAALALVWLHGFLRRGKLYKLLKSFHANEFMPQRCLRI